MRAIKNLVDGATENHELHFATNHCLRPSRVRVEIYVRYIFQRAIDIAIIYGLFDRFTSKFYSTRSSMILYLSLSCLIKENREFAAN